ncbi:non-ribosomal peptide synthetase, partial [Glaciimonas sp. GG7]
VHGDGIGLEEAQRELNTTLSQRLRQQARQLGVSAASLCHLAWAQVLARVSNRSDVVFGTVLFGRMGGDEGVQQMMGLLINTLPLRINIDQQGAAASVRQTHALLAELMEHEHASLALAQRASAIAAPQPLFSALLNYRHSLYNATSPIWESVTQIAGEERSNYPLTMSIDDLGTDFALTVQVTAAVGALRVCRFMETALEGLVTALETTPERAINSIDVLPAMERHQLVTSWNTTQIHYPERACLLHQLVEAQAAQTPHAVAVASGAVQLSYAELNAQANQLAHYLRELGVGPDDRVAICVDRGLAMVVGLLGVLKAGAGYVPLDPGYPAERLMHMLADSAPRVVLSGVLMQAGIADGWEQARTTIAPDVPVLDLHAPSWGAYPTENPDSSHLKASDLAYVIYTSGSTGQPKGVMNEHCGVVNRMLWMQQAYGLEPRDVVLQKTPFSFDVSVWEFFWPLMVGAKLVMAKPDGHKDPHYLSELIRTAGVTTLHFVPSMLQAFTGHEDTASCTSIVRVMCSGEALPAALVQRFHAQLPDAQLHNLYGPTEAAVDVTAWTCVAGATGTTI